MYYVVCSQIDELFDLGKCCTVTVLPCLCFVVVPCHLSNIAGERGAPLGHSLLVKCSYLSAVQ